jgi:ubiquinone/menaquinone biosynthesis C-methylase UbiE
MVNIKKQIKKTPLGRWILDRKHHFDSAISMVSRKIMHKIHYSRSRETQQLHQWLLLSSDDTLLDIGCGDGFWTKRLSRECHMTVGLDIDMEPLSIAKATNNSESLIYTRGAAESLPFPDNHFSTIVSVCALEHFIDNKKAFAEMARVLKSGGRLALSCDSLSLRFIKNDFREDHRRKYYVNQYYDSNLLCSLLASAGLNIEDYLFLTNSWGSHFMAQAQIRFRFNVILSALTYPILYPLSRLSDRFASIPEEGYKLLVVAKCDKEL